jgi:CheY-like chemotaxis protein
MHWVQTAADEAVNIRDAVDTGRILVVDDDRVFGGFMIAALETRGHDVEWAGSVQDALTSLYSRRYDLAIIDLRLPDGNGIELLRDATDEGLLEDTAAIILTGHDFDEPDDIRVYHKPLDLDPFLDRMGGIVSHAKKRRAMAHRAPTHQRGVSNDDSRQRKSPKIELVLYTSASSEKCRRCSSNTTARTSTFRSATSPRTARMPIATRWCSRRRWSSAVQGRGHGSSATSISRSC